MSDKIRAIIDAATPGPWIHQPRCTPHRATAVGTSGSYPFVCECGFPINKSAHPQDVADAHFIATFDPEYEALRQDVIDAARTVREWSGASSPEDIVAHYHAEKALDGALHFLTAYEKKEGLR